MEALQLILFLIVIFKTSVEATEDVHTLRSITVVFRHGDRAPDPMPKELYPNDPYKNHSFHPVGHGSLTNYGKMREYQLGAQLRQRYNSFLGDNYRFSDVSAISTAYARTRMSLLLVLAGLYPPKNKQIWNSHLNWQPIPISYVPFESPSFIKPRTCPTYQKVLNRVKDTEEYRQELAKHVHLMKDLTALTGKYIVDTRGIYGIYQTLESERAMDLPLPEWTKAFYPNGSILNAVLFEYKTENYNTILTKLNGGSFVKKILDDTIWMRKEGGIPKVYLYSVHNENVAALLIALNIWKNVVPRYSSAVIVELHEIDSKFFYKFVHYKGIPAEFEELTLPGCSKYCLLDNFIELYAGILPANALEACFGSADNSYLTSRSNVINSIYKRVTEWFNL